MKIYKEIDIDLDLFVRNLNNKKYNYTDSEKLKLSILYSDFADGRFEEAVKYVKTWKNEEKELIPCEIWDVLFNVSMGGKYKVDEQQ